MQFFNRFTLALTVVATMLLAALPQRSDADVSIGIGAGIGISAGIGLNVDIAPPALPVYVQPAAPYANAIWQPGYWAWGPYGYYWVPGTWVAAPQPGYLWTPGYWGFGGGYYAWHPGYWATHVGFYGGINYGFGYFGRGFVGGGWFGDAFRYNTAVVNVDRTVIRNTYIDRTVIVNNYNTNVTRVSYNGGVYGVRAVPTEDERSVEAGQHLAMTSEQRDNMRYAQQNRNNLSSVNDGRPMEAAAARPFSQDNPSRNFDRVNDEDRTNAAPLQSHVRTNGQPGYHPAALNRPQSQFQQTRPQSQIEQSRPQTFEQSRPQSQFQQTRPQSQVEQARPQSQFQQARPQSQFQQTRPQSQAQSRPQQQYHPQNTYRPQQQRSYQQAPRERQAEPHPRATGRPRPPR